MTILCLDRIALNTAAGLHLHAPSADVVEEMTQRFDATGVVHSVSTLSPAQAATAGLAVDST